MPAIDGNGTEPVCSRPAGNALREVSLHSATGHPVTVSLHSTPVSTASRCLPGATETGIVERRGGRARVGAFALPIRIAAADGPIVERRIRCRGGRSSRKKS
jgi:hypothetical protein